MVMIDEQFWKDWCDLQVAKAFDRLYSDEALLKEANTTKKKLKEIKIGR